MNKIHSQRSLVVALAVLAFGCSDTATDPGTASNAATPSTPTAAAPNTTPAAAAGGAAVAARPANAAPMAQASAAVAGSAAKPPTATPSTSATPTTPSAAGAPAATSGAAGATAAAGTSAASAGSAGSAAAAGSGAVTSAAGKLPRVTTTDGPGPYKEVVKVKSTPPGGWLIYPKDIGKDGVKHPLFIFGPGGGTNPMKYETDGMHWDRYGSYGFVIYCIPESTGDGAAMKKGLDWLIKENDNMMSPLYQKLDTTKVAAAGHSMGSITTFDLMPDDRVTTTIHISGGSFDGMGPSHLKSDTMFLCGPDGNADVAFPQCEGDFMNTKVPTYYTNIKGSTHLTSGRLGWASIIAWLLWHLADQGDQWKKEFVEPTGQFQMGIYKAQIKNW